MGRFIPLSKPAEEAHVPSPVLTKTDFVRRYEAGEFGNHAPTWGTLQEWLDRDWGTPDQLYHIRNRVKGGLTWYDVPIRRVVSAWSKASKIYGAYNLYISAMAPTEKTLFQGEVQRGLHGLDLYYSTVVATMREALSKQAHSCYGIIALTLLRRFLCPNSLDWLMCLLETYPDHVVEFSTYSCQWGTLPGFNTVFWEVRKY